MIKASLERSWPLLSTDSEFHRRTEVYRHVPTKEPCVNKFDDSLVDEREHFLPLADFCR